jgi:hypothetical protein
MGASEDRLGEQARARVARAAARVAGCDDDPEREAQRELYDAVAFAATEARLDLRELIDAYGQGVPEVAFSDAWDAVEDCMDEVAFLSWYRVAAACQDAARVAPDWRGRLRLAIVAHNLALVVYRARGFHYDRVEQMRLQLAAVLTETTAAGVDREDLLKTICVLQTQECTVLHVLAAAAWFGALRVSRRRNPFGRRWWATPLEIARDRVVPLPVVRALIDDAHRRGFVSTGRHGRVSVTPAGHAYLKRTARP